MSLLTAPSESTPLSQLFSLQDKVCLVTGGNRGIGFAICQGYAEAGARAIAIIHSSEKTSALATQRALEIQAAYPTTTTKAYKADVSNSEEIDTVTKQVFEEFGRLDVVVVNAGVYTDTPALEMKPEEAQYINGVNHLGALYTAQSAAMIMKENGGGKIVFTASINGHMVLRPQRESIYCATKAAVVHLARALAVEFAQYNIQVNSVSPGYIDTEMNDIMIQKYPDQVNNWLGDCPAGRFCKVWELKGVYVFLASLASSYVTGADYLVDGSHPMLPRRTLPLSPGSFVIILLHLSLTFGTTALHYLNPQADKYFIPGGAGMAAIVCIGLIADSLEELRRRREVSDQESSVRDMVI